jgi:hypothetical protein
MFTLRKSFSSLTEKRWLLSTIKELVNSPELLDREFQKAFKAASVGCKSAEK